ncbi:MAG: hypothetical protein ABIU77_13880 [Ferruginibacter sp.]
MQQVLIDKIAVPANAKEAFIQRMNYNRDFIKKLTGFLKDEVYEQTDESGNLICTTIAVWENADALKKAKETVDAEYKRIGFNAAEFCERLNIKFERGIYQPMDY